MESAASSELINEEHLDDGRSSLASEPIKTISDLLREDRWSIHDLNNLLSKHGTNRYGCINVNNWHVVSIEHLDGWVILKELKENRNSVFFFHLSDKSFRCFVDAEEVGIVKEETVEYNGCVNLDANGRRWEGGVKDGKPFGYGVLFDEDGRIEYEVFIGDGLRLCYGTEYYSDIGQMKYVGGYYDDDRFGYGVLYDRNGNVDYDGLWNNDTPYAPAVDTIDSLSDIIRLSDDSINTMESLFFPSFLLSLKEIVIGDMCFRSVRSFELNNLPSLESIWISHHSFKYSTSFSLIGLID